MDYFSNRGNREFTKLERAQAAENGLVQCLCGSPHCRGLTC